MGRRGWESLGDGQFRTEISETDYDNRDSIDERVVQIIERDVKQSSYVADIKDYEVVCLLKSDGPVFENDFDLDDVGSGIDFA
ncbi:MAG: hypothetical protein FJ267_08095 [Planctomycetes bacterium]|nr:hypothetical protein [Planctomycetota bacterium]